MRAGQREKNRDYLADALSLLKGWTRDGRDFRRVLRLDDAQHAALTERLKIAADALQLRPAVLRIDGDTQIRLMSNEDRITQGEVALAARIEDLYRTITDTNEILPARIPPSQP